MRRFSSRFKLFANVTFIAFKYLSAICLISCNFQRASKSLKVCENVVRVSNSLDPDEMPSYLVSHSDPSCLHMEL